MCTWRHCNRYAIQKMSRVSLIFCSFVELFGTGLRFSVSTKYAYGFVALCFVVVISSTPGGFTWYIYSYLPFLLHWHWDTYDSLRWRHNGHDSVSNHQPPDCLLSRLFRRKSKKTSKLRLAGLCAVNSPGTGEFPAQMASNAENVSIWWRHHVPPRKWSNPEL